MATNKEIRLYETNDTVIDLALTTNIPAEGTVLNLGGCTAEAFLKPGPTTADTDATVWKGTLASGVAITNASGGLVSITVPRANVTLDKGWWRLDVIAADTSRKTAVYGKVTVVDL